MSLGQHRNMVLMGDSLQIGQEGGQTRSAFAREAEGCSPSFLPQLKIFEASLRSQNFACSLSTSQTFWNQSRKQEDEEDFVRCSRDGQAAVSRTASAMGGGHQS